MLRVMRAGGTRVGSMEECWRQVNGCSLPEAFKLKLVNSMLRQMNEVSALQRGIEDESGFEADTTSYLNIILAKDESDLMRRVSQCRCLKQVRTPAASAAGAGWSFCSQTTSAFFLHLLLALTTGALELVSCYPRGSSSVPSLTTTIWMPRLPCGTLHPLIREDTAVSPANKPSHTQPSLFLQSKKAVLRSETDSGPQGKYGWLRGAACGSHSRGRRSGSGLRGRSSGRERRPLALTACWRQAVFCRCRRQTRRGMQIRGSFLVTKNIWRLSLPCPAPIVGSFHPSMPCELRGHIFTPTPRDGLSSPNQPPCCVIGSVPLYKRAKDRCNFFPLCGSLAPCAWTQCAVSCKLKCSRVPQLQRGERLVFSANRFRFDRTSTRSGSSGESKRSPSSTPSVP